MPTEAQLASQLRRLSEELDKRTARHNLLLPYSRRTDRRPIPPAVVRAKLKRAYDDLMSMSAMPWGKLIIRSKLDRLEPNGIDVGNKETNSRLWSDVWQANAMDLESKLAHHAALRDGRAHALVWPDRNGKPVITLDDCTQMIVQFEEGSRRLRRAAMRRWLDDDDTEFATLYRPDAAYKFRKRREGERPGGESAAVVNSGWVRREVEGEEWPLKNPFRSGAVPAVELAVNRELEPGSFSFARGEYEDEVGLMERVDLLTFLGLIVAIWMGFPLRVVLGDKIIWEAITDDDGNPVLAPDGKPKRRATPPFDAEADTVAQLENPQAKIDQFTAADRSNLSIYGELAQLAAATTTPRHYFPTDSGIANIAEPTLRAFEAPMIATVNGSHKPSLAEGWEEVNRLGGELLGIDVPPTAQMGWADHESRSLAERADAFVKLSSGETGLPWTLAAELALNLGQETIRRVEAEQAGSAIAKLIAAAGENSDGTPEPEPAAA